MTEMVSSTASFNNSNDDALFFRRQGRLGIFLSLLLFFSTKIEHSCALESPIEQLPTFKPQCFDEVYTGRPNFSPGLEKFLSFRNTIKLEVAWWETSYMLTHAFSILLTEKLGYRTEINDFTKMNYTQFAMENDITNASFANALTSSTMHAYMNLYFGTTSMNPELWPATGSIAKKYAESQVTKTLPNIVQYPGTLGPTARNGWFFDPSSLSEDLKADPFTSLAMIEEKGGFTPGHANAFTLSQELGVGNFNIAYHTFADGVASGLNCSGETKLGEYLGGQSDCEYWRWVPLDDEGNPICCTYRNQEEGSCDTALTPCFAMVVGDPGWLSPDEKNEKRALMSGLPIEIVYGDTKSFLETAEGIGKPFLFYWWEPDLFIDGNTFVRVNMLDEIYCAHEVLKEESVYSTYGFKHDESSANAPCEFYKDTLEKGTHSPDALYFSDAFYLLQQFTLDFDQIWQLANFTNNSTIAALADEIISANPNAALSEVPDSDMDSYYGNESWNETDRTERFKMHLSYNLGACAWLKENEALWKEYIVPDEFIFNECLIVVCIALGIFVWVAGQSMHFFNSTGYKVLLQKALDALEQFTIAPVFVGKVNQFESIEMTPLESSQFESMKNKSSSSKVPNISFCSTLISALGDEDFIEFTVTSSERSDDANKGFFYVTIYDGVFRSEVPNSRSKESLMQFGRDYSSPQLSTSSIASENNDVFCESSNFKEVEVINYGRTLKLPIALPKGALTLQLPLLTNKLYCSVREAHAIIESGHKYGDEDARAITSDIPVLTFNVHTARRFPNNLEAQKSKGDDDDMLTIVGIWKILNAFGKDCFRVNQVRWQFFSYQVAHLILSMLDTFVWSLLMTFLIDFGLSLKKTDWCLMVALSYLSIEMIRYHFSLHYVNGDYNLKVYLESVLLRKFVFLSAGDVSQIPDHESIFRVAALTDVGALINEMWTPLHNILIQLYRVIGAFSFLLYKFQGQLYLTLIRVAWIVPLGFIGFASVYMACRVPRGFAIGVQEDHLEVIIFSSMYTILHNSRIIRELRQKMDIISNHFDKLWYKIDGGTFERMYHCLFNTWFLQTISIVIAAMLYGMASSMIQDWTGDTNNVTVGQYLVSIGAIRQLLAGLVQIFVLFSSVLESASKIKHIADLVNFETSLERRLRNHHGIETDEGYFYRDHEPTNPCLNEKDTHMAEGEEYVLVIDGATLDYNQLDPKAPQYVFKNLELVEHRSRKSRKCLPRGGIIGIRRTDDGASKVLLNALSHEDICQKGKIGFSPDLYVARVDTSKSALYMNETLWQNLVMGVDCAAFKKYQVQTKEWMEFQNYRRRITPRHLYKLCKRIGLNASIIGKNYSPAFGEISMDCCEELMDSNQVIRIRLVQALLQRPDVLVLDGVGDEMEQSEIKQMVDIFREFLDYKLDFIDDDAEKLAVGGKVKKRTIVWVAYQRTIQDQLKSDEIVLVQTSQSQFSMCGKDTAFTNIAHVTQKGESLVSAKSFNALSSKSSKSFRGR